MRDIHKDRHADMYIHECTDKKTVIKSECTCLVLIYEERQRDTVEAQVYAHP